MEWGGWDLQHCCIKQYWMRWYFRVKNKRRNPCGWWKIECLMPDWGVEVIAVVFWSVVSGSRIRGAGPTSTLYAWLKSWIYGSKTGRGGVEGSTSFWSVRSSAGDPVFRASIISVGISTYKPDELSPSTLKRRISRYTPANNKDTDSCFLAIFTALNYGLLIW